MHFGPVETYLEISTIADGRALCPLFSSSVKVEKIRSYVWLPEISLEKIISSVWLPEIRFITDKHKLYLLLLESQLSTSRISLNVLTLLILKLARMSYG